MIKEQPEFSKYERARILGARALQISMDAPLLMKMDEKLLDNLNYDPLKLAETELDSGVLPITINTPMPEKKAERLKELRVEELEKDEPEKKAEDKEEKKEDEEDKVEIIKEQLQQEVADMKSDEELGEEIEEGGVETEVGGSEESSYEE